MEKEYVLQQLTMDKIYKYLMQWIEKYNDDKYVFKIHLPDEDEEKLDMYNLAGLKDIIPDCYKALKQSSNEPKMILSISEVIEYKNNLIATDTHSFLYIKICLLLLGLDGGLSGPYELNDKGLERLHKQQKDLKEEEKRENKQKKNRRRKKRRANNSWKKPPKTKSKYDKRNCGDEPNCPPPSYAPPLPKYLPNGEKL